MRGQVVGDRDEQVDSFADVAPHRGDADLEAGGQAGQGVPVAQVGQGEPGLPAGAEPPPSGSPLFPVGSDEVAQVVQDRVDYGVAAG